MKSSLLINGLWILQALSLGCQPAQSSSTLSVDSTPDRFLYSIVSDDTIEGHLSTGFELYVLNGTRRFAARIGASSLIRTQADTPQAIRYVSDVSQDSWLEILCAEDQQCDLTAGISISNEEGVKYSVKCSAKITHLPNNPLDYTLLDCKKVDSENTPSKLKLFIMVPKNSSNVVKVKPSTQFEFFRVGSILKWHDWKVPVLDKTSPVTFEVDARLMRQDSFVQAFNKAVHYWNEAAGLTLINPQVKVVNELKFSPLSSQIFLASPGADMTVVARGLPFADSVTGELLALKIDVMRPDEKFLASTLAHEMGHTLGLAHNFAASADPLKGTLGSTSVMDYLDYYAVESIKDLATVLPYDRAAMRYLYQGEKPSQNFLHCNDLQIPFMLDCDKFNLPYDSVVLTAIMESYDTKTIAYHFSEKSEVAIKALEDRNLEASRDNFIDLKIPFLTSAFKHLWYNRKMTIDEKNRLMLVTRTFLEKIKDQVRAKKSALIERELDVYLGYLNKNPFELINCKSPK